MPAMTLSCSAQLGGRGHSAAGAASTNASSAANARRTTLLRSSHSSRRQRGASTNAPSEAATAETSKVINAKQIILSAGGAQQAQQPAAAAVPAPAAAATPEVPLTAEVEYLTGRATMVQRHFASALGADDFMQRVEMALYAFGFSGDNSIAMVNLCRDEVTVTLKHRIEQVFGSAFSTNGLGGVLTCGATGMGAGFSHSPLCDSGRERYVFFSFPHISINSKGEVGPMSRPGRPGQSCACGALIKCQGELKSQGLTCNCKIPGVHDALDPEYSILKQRIARRLRHEGATDESVKSLSLTDITKVAERTISDDLEYLISQTVNTDKADYAVITGVQIHNWSTNFEDDSPNLEFVAPTSVYVVVNGQKTHIDLTAMPPLAPRQMRKVAGPAVVCNQGGQSTLRDEGAPYAFDSKDVRQQQRQRLQSYVRLMKEEGLEGVAETPCWQAKVAAAGAAGARQARPEQDNSTIIDTTFTSDENLQEVWDALEQRYRLPPPVTSRRPSRGRA